MQLIKDIIENWGFVDSVQIKELIKYFPNTPLCIKWGMREREECFAQFVPSRIEKVESESDDYVREVFIRTEHYRQLKTILGVE
jgi:hypothetical protein|tara:strand:- start:514 stop:765 length:252 start_codon:yes stop_codon:yes gene_type:complete